MKTRIQSWARVVTITLGVAFTAIAESAPGASASELLERGIYLEETTGDIKAAAAVYQQLIDDPAAHRSFAAQAQLRLGLCQLKLGDKKHAISVLERLAQEFPDKDRLLALIEHQMPQLLDEMLKQIEQNYFLEVDRGELIQTAVRAIIGKLDASGGVLRTNDTAFLDARELDDLNVNLEQKVAGIGAVLKMDEATREIVIATPLPHSPAANAGVVAGDRIAAVNGAELSKDAKIEAVVKMLRGAAGTAVTLGIKRAGADHPLNIKVVRDVIPLPSAKGYALKADNMWEFMLDAGGTGYIRLDYFGKQSPEEIRAVVDDLRSRGMKGLVLDLRSNPGGSLDAAIAVADLFVENGRILTVKSRSGEKHYDAKPEGTYSGFPMAVLVNRKTASAAEIVAACLQDHQRGAIIGERTYGQGIVRSLIPLKGGIGALKLPVAAYYRPSGKNVNRYPQSTDAEDWGVSPTAGCEVMLTDEQLKEYERDRAAREIVNRGDTPHPQFYDEQLMKARDYIRAQLE